jgi:hypothetical protein
LGAAGRRDRLPGEASSSALKLQRAKLGVNTWRLQIRLYKLDAALGTALVHGGREKQQLVP